MGVEAFDVVVAGAGPAGASTALHLARSEPDRAGRIVLLEKDAHPRPKLCAGGVTRPGEAVLAGLGLPFEPGHVPVRTMRVRYGDREIVIRDDPLFRVTRREEFDAWLVGRAREAGVSVRERVTAEDVQLDAEGVEVATGHGRLRARALVVADGSRSRLRRRLGWRHGRLARLLEVVTPAAGGRAVGGGEALFDFGPVRGGLRGYTWRFPMRVEGAACWNEGVFDGPAGRGDRHAPLLPLLADALARVAPTRPEGHPILCFDPRSALARPRVLLVGDAAGVDPFLGEGISFALAYGEVAAAAVRDAFARGDWSFRNYRRRVLLHPVLRGLVPRVLLAALLYRAPRAWQREILWWWSGAVARVHQGWRHGPLGRPAPIRLARSRR